MCIVYVECDFTKTVRSKIENNILRAVLVAYILFYDVY